MVDTDMKVSLYSPERPLAEVTADNLQVPGILGYMGVKPGHTALISELGMGELKIEGGDAGSEHHYFVSGGYVEIAGNEVKVLVDVVERIEEIDLDRAEKSEKRAFERLEEKSDLKLDISRALAALERAKARRKLAQSKSS